MKRFEFTENGKCKNPNIPFWIEDEFFCLKITTAWTGLSWDFGYLHPAAAGFIKKGRKTPYQNESHAILAAMELMDVLLERGKPEIMIEKDWQQMLSQWKKFKQGKQLNLF